MTSTQDMRDRHDPDELVGQVVDTSLGALALAWRGEVLVRVVLPERDAGRAQRRMSGLLAVPLHWAQARAALPAMQDVAARLRRYADGDRVDFQDVAVAFGQIEPFSVAVYAALRELRHGEAITYGELARRAGFAEGARAVGAAMGRNPAPLIVPCHRVVAAGGRIGGFSAPGGSVTKARLLAHEHARVVRSDDTQTCLDL